MMRSNFQINRSEQKKIQKVHGFSIKIYGDDGKYYCSTVNFGRARRRIPAILGIARLETEKNKSKGFRYRIRINLPLRRRNYNEKNIIGLEVSIYKRDRDGNNLVRGKIISAAPKIIGTQPGSSGLPPVDE